MSRGGFLSGIKLTKKHTREMFCHPHISDIARHILICGAKDVGSVIIYMSWYLARHSSFTRHCFNLSNQDNKSGP